MRAAGLERSMILGAAGDDTMLKTLMSNKHWNGRPQRAECEACLCRRQTAQQAPTEYEADWSSYVKDACRADPSLEGAF